MRAYELIYGTLFNPTAVFRYVAENKPIGRVFAVWLAALAFGAAVSFNLLRMNVASRITPGWAALSERVAGFSWAYGVGYVAVSLLVWFVWAAVYSLLSELLYRRGNGVGLLAALALAGLPGILGPAFQLLGRVMAWEAPLVLLSLGAGLWTFGLQVLALREVLGLSTSQALFLWFLPVLTLGLLATTIMALVLVAAGQVWS